MNSVVDEVKWNLLEPCSKAYYEWNDLLWYQPHPDARTGLYSVQHPSTGFSGLGSSLKEAYEDWLDWMRHYCDSKTESLESIAKRCPLYDWMLLDFVEGKFVTNVEKFDDGSWKFYFHDGSTATLSVTINVDVKRQEPLY